MVLAKALEIQVVPYNFFDIVSEFRMRCDAVENVDVYSMCRNEYTIDAELRVGFQFLADKADGFDVSSSEEDQNMTKKLRGKIQESHRGEVMYAPMMKVRKTMLALKNAVF